MRIYMRELCRFVLQQTSLVRFDTNLWLHIPKNCNTPKSNESPIECFVSCHSITYNVIAGRNVEGQHSDAGHNTLLVNTRIVNPEERAQSTSFAVFSPFYQRLSFGIRIVIRFILFAPSVTEHFDKEPQAILCSSIGSLCEGDCLLLRHSSQWTT